MYSSTRAKNMVYPEWFKSQYADPSRTETVPVEQNFRIDWHTLNIIKKKTLVRLGIKQGTKRIPVYHRDVWVDTDPIDIIDLSCLDHIGKQIRKSLRNEVRLLQSENNILNEKFSQKEREIEERYKEINLTKDRTLLDKEEEPTEVTKDEKAKTDEDEEKR